MRLARAEDALGRRSDELFAPQRAEAYMKPDREGIASGKPILNLVRFIPEDRSLSDIALACGFCDQSHFCRIFSRIRGKTPSAYRREILTVVPT